MIKSLRRVAVVCVCVLASGPAHAQHESHGPANEDKLGTVDFQTSCGAAAQPAFNHAVALLHSFEFGRAIAGFNAVLGAERSCAMAEWGIALSRWGNPFAPGRKSGAQVQAGLDAIRRARTLHAATDRERGFIDCAAKLYEDADRLPQQARVNAYRDAMGALAAKYPHDDETRIFYSLAVAMAADPADKSYAELLKAGAILEALFARRPDHPGLAHYIIHAYDVPPLAERALDAARKYAAIAPAAPHALHMPSHTFTRTGFWQESIDTNIESAASARRDGAIGEELHASDYQIYAYLQTGQDSAAGRVLRVLPDLVNRYDPSVITGAAPPMAAYFAMAAMPARYALERGAWSEAAALEPRATDFPHTEALTYFARAIGAARLRQLDAAQSSLDALTERRDRLSAAGEAYWAEQVEIERRGAAAWLALARGRRDDAISEMRAAADREDATEKSAVTPGPLAPAREMLGEMLLDTGAPAAALAEFRATLRKEPNRFRAIAGAARAAAAAGDRAMATQYYGELLNICARGDQPGRPELIEARQMAAAR